MTDPRVVAAGSDVDQRIAEIEAAVAAATSGPWNVYEDTASECTVRAPKHGVVASVRVAWVHAYKRAEQAANAKLIANTPEYLAWLLATLRETRAQLAEATRQGMMVYIHSSSGDVPIDVLAHYRGRGFGALPPVPTMTGAEIRFYAAWDVEGYTLCIDRHGDGTRIPSGKSIGWGESVLLEHGMRFIFVPPAIY